MLCRICAVLGVGVCGPTIQAVNDGVFMTCSGALVQNKSCWAKPRGWARGNLRHCTPVGSKCKLPLGFGRKSASRAKLKISGFLSPCGIKEVENVSLYWLTIEISYGFYSKSTKMFVKVIYKMKQECGLLLTKFKFNKKIKISILYIIKYNI